MSRVDQKSITIHNLIKHVVRVDILHQPHKHFTPAAVKECHLLAYIISYRIHRCDKTEWKINNNIY